MIVNMSVPRRCGLCGKSARDGCADSFGASGDGNDFVFEFEVEHFPRPSIPAAHPIVSNQDLVIADNPAICPELFVVR